MGRLRVTQKKKTAGKKAPSPQEVFAKLWKQVQNEQLLLGQLPGQIQQFFNLYSEGCGRLETQWCELQRDEIQLLLTHWPRKTLRDRERILLVQYIISTFTELKENPFRSFDLTVLEDTIHHVLLPDADDSELHDDLFDDLDKAEDEQGADKKQRETEDFFEEDADFDEFFNEQFSRAQRSQNDTASELFNATSLNKMFRQLSKVLHPDLEQDEEQKKHKHELMSQLLTARDKHDVGAIVALYSQYIGGDGAQFAAEDFPRLTLLLKKQLRDLQLEKRSIAAQSLPGLVYQRYHHKNPTRQKNLLRERESILQQMCEDIKYSLAANATVKNLKSFLADWEGEQMESMFFDFDEL